MESFQHNLIVINYLSIEVTEDQFGEIVREKNQDSGSEIKVERAPGEWYRIATHRCRKEPRQTERTSKVEKLRHGGVGKGWNLQHQDGSSPTPPPGPSGHGVCEKERPLTEKAAALKEGSQVLVRASSWSDGTRMRSWAIPKGGELVGEAAKAKRVP